MKVIRNGIERQLTAEEIAEREREDQARQLENLATLKVQEARNEIEKSISLRERIEYIELALLDIINPEQGSTQRLGDFADRVEAIHRLLDEARSAASEERRPDS